MKSFLLSLFLVISAEAADSGTPGEAAVRYLESVRSGKVDLEPQKGTAISPATGKDKQKLIKERIQRLAKELGPSALETGPQTVDGDMAAVLVHQAGGFDPARLRVVPIGLIRKGEEWVPAPLPGSFENTGLGYDASRSDRLAKLEAWMMREQVLDLATLRDQSTERLKKAIESKLSKDQLRTMTAEQVVKRFLSACSEKDQATILGLLGGLEPELPKEWSSLLAAVDQAFSDDTPRSAWRKLATSGVIRTILNLENVESGSTVTVALLDTSESVNRSELPKISIMTLVLHQNRSGLYRVELPPDFLLGAAENRESEEEDDEEDLLGGLPAAWRRDVPAAKLNSAKEASEALLVALGAEKPDGLLGLLDLSGDAEVARQGAARVTLVWREAHHPRDLRTLLPVVFHEEGDGAVSVFQIFSSREPDRSDLRAFYFIKKPEGWLLVSGLRPADPIQPELSAVKAWSDEHAPEWTKNWESIVLGKSAALDGLPEGEAPSEDATRAAFEAWRNAILHGDVPAAIEGTGYLKGEKGAARLLRNLGAELTAAQKDGSQAAVLGVIRRGPWTAVSARIGKKGDPTATYPLYSFVATPGGARVLAEIDLSANGNRTREFLNEATWGRLEAQGAVKASAQLREIYEIHRKNAEADRAPSP